MGRQQKRKDPKKRKKAAEAASAKVADKQPEKSSALSLTRAGAVSRSKGPKPVAKPVKKEADSGIRRYVDVSLQFLREVRVELKKVTWPSRKQTVGSTAVVLVLVLLVSVFLGIVDFGLSNLIRLVIG